MLTCMTERHSYCSEVTICSITFGVFFLLQVAQQIKLLPFASASVWLRYSAGLKNKSVLLCLFLMSPKVRKRELANVSMTIDERVNAEPNAQ